MDIQAKLMQLARTGNKKFSQSLHPGIDNILGLRVPDVRKLACDIAKSDWRTYLAQAGHIYMEERMLHGMVIGAVKNMPLAERLELLSAFIPFINSWSVCDTVCPMLKFAKDHPEEVWQFILPYFRSSDEYAVRFAVVMGLGYYVNAGYLSRLLEQLNIVRHEGYYAKMAVAWAVSVCFVGFPKETEAFLQHNALDSFTQCKSIQKIRESYRVDAASKQRILQYKR